MVRQFKEQYIRQGVEGGKRAAYALRQAIATECGEHAHEVEVTCRVFANLAGLTKAMRRDGSLEQESDLKDFSLGFTQGQASFDFVDVGYGKERADSKLKGERGAHAVCRRLGRGLRLMLFTEATKWHLRNVNCKQIVLGISHDAGYAPFLDEVLRDDETRRRITILEGYPTVRELMITNINRLNLNDTLFRSEKLVDKSARLPTPPQILNSPPVTTVSAPPLSTTPSSNSGGAPSWAGVISSASPPPTLVLPMQTKSIQGKGAARSVKPPAPTVQWNPGARGLDAPIQVNQSVLDNIKKRKDGDKLCNNHYLRGPCQKGDSCCFEHRYRPSPEEKIAIAFLARLNPCTNGQDCETDDCIYGHHVSDAMFPWSSPPGIPFLTASNIVPKRPRWTVHAPFLQIPA